MLTPDLLVSALHESIKLFLCDAVLAQRVIVRVHGHRTERDDLIAVQNADVLAFGGTLQQRRKIGSGLRGGKGCHESILRRYGEQNKSEAVASRH